MARFKYKDDSQGLFLSVNLSEQLLPGTFEWTLDYLIDRADLSLYEQKYHNDKKGASAYPPKALLKMVLYCYSMGILSSRRIEKAGKTNMIVKALAQDFEPDHDTIAAFISTNREGVKDIFSQVLLQCDELDLITGEMYALDGCKLPSNASKEWSGTIEKLTKKKERLEKHIERLLVRHKELDSSEEAKKILEPYEKTMGKDEERRKRSIERLEKKLKKLEDFLKGAKERKGASGGEVQSNITDNKSAKIKGPHGYIQGYNGLAIADSGNQIIVSAEAVGVSESESFAKMLDSVEENMEKVKGKKEEVKKPLFLQDTGFFSEKNLQEAKRRGIEVISPDPQFRQRDADFEGVKEGKEGKKKKEEKRYTVEDFEYDEKGKRYICPKGKGLEYKGRVELRNNEGDKYQGKWKDCGECPDKEKCIKIKNKEGKKHFRTLLIAGKKYEENLSQQMREKIDNPAYRELYSRRQQIIEPTFSDITYCKGMNRYMLRGEEKVDTQWKMYCIVHNIGKCKKALMKKEGA
jgi:transposase